jgi:hypothetical protein
LAMRGIEGTGGKLGDVNWLVEEVEEEKNERAGVTGVGGREKVGAEKEGAADSSATVSNVGEVGVYADFR